MAFIVGGAAVIVHAVTVGIAVVVVGGGAVVAVLASLF